MLITLAHVIIENLHKSPMEAVGCLVASVFFLEIFISFVMDGASRMSFLSNKRFLLLGTLQFLGQISRRGLDVPFHRGIIFQLPPTA